MIKAIKNGDEEALKTMIKEGKNLAEPNKEGWLPLHEAAYYGQLGCLKVLQRGEGWALDVARGGKGTGGRAAAPGASCSLPTTTLVRRTGKAVTFVCQLVTELGEGR